MTDFVGSVRAAHGDEDRQLAERLGSLVGHLDVDDHGGIAVGIGEAGDPGREDLVPGTEPGETLFGGFLVTAGGQDGGDQCDEGDEGGDASHG